MYGTLTDLEYGLEGMKMVMNLFALLVAVRYVLIPSIRSYRESS